jgi:hypothetical protein
VIDCDHPWARVPPIDFPVILHKGRSPELDALFDLPGESSLTIARVDPLTGKLDSVDWRGRGEWGFYPASSIKLITAAMTLAFLDWHHLPIDSVVKLGEDSPITFRELLAETIVFSGNETFNTLAEVVGFAETWQQTRQWGLVKLLVRRNFKSPRYNHSRQVIVYGASGSVLLEIPPRPAPVIPFHDGNGQANQNLESNWACTDDLVRAMAAILFGPTRNSRYFSQLTGWCGMTNRCFFRDGLRKITAEASHHPAFVILNKPGWWPDDGVNVDFGYIYDVSQSAHYLYAAYYHGTEESAGAGLSKAALQIFNHIHADNKIATTPLFPLTKSGHSL